VGSTFTRFLGDVRLTTHSQQIASVVRYEYEPSLPDELLIATGQVLHVLVEYSDGWALCKNRHGLEGMVPQECLGRGGAAQTLGVGGRGFRRSQRTSSMLPQVPSEDCTSSYVSSFFGDSRIISREI
jgi:hypothetical protein